MASTEKGGGRSKPFVETGTSTPPTRNSPGDSMTATMDLLTGLFTSDYPSSSSLPGPDAEPRSVGDGGGTPANVNSSTNNGGAGLSTSPMSPDPFYNNFAQQQQRPMPSDSIFSYSTQQQQHEPLDLLTGLFPPPAPSSTHLAPQNSWGVEELAFPPFHGGDDSIRDDHFPYSEGPHQSNPFFDNVASTSSPADSSLISRRRSDAGEASVKSKTSSCRPISSSASVDSLFAQFPRIGESFSDHRSSADSWFSRDPAMNEVPEDPQHATGSPGNAANVGGPAMISRSSSSSPANSPSTDSEPSSRHFTAATEIDTVEWTQHKGSTRGSAERIFQHSESCPTRLVRPVTSTALNENLRRVSSESEQEKLHDQWSSPGEGSSPGSGSGSSKFRVTGVESTASGEFFGASVKGVLYRAPTRGAVHPGRPVSLELRPHPLRGTLSNQITRIVSLEGSLWAACDYGLMFWDVENSTGEGSSGAGNDLGDVDTASYELFRVEGSSILCMAADFANQVVWTGHRDGTIRSWPSSLRANASSGRRPRGLTVEAHRPAVTALTFTPYGELWAGFESGELKAWSWVAVANALYGEGDGAALMEKSYSDLRIGNVGMGPNGPINPEVRFLVGDHTHGTVWCAGAQYISIWDARTRERLRIFLGPSGLDLNSVDVDTLGREIYLEEEFKGGYAKFPTKKDKGGWLQRSRNAVMGAADAVRRVASGVGQGGEEGKKLEALVATLDGTIWGGYGSGILAQWDWEGTKMREFIFRPVGVKCLCVVGSRLWVGYSDGKLQILENEEPVGSWLAHRFALNQMALCRGYIFSLGQSGSIRGWNISCPNKQLNTILAKTLSKRADSYTRQRQFQILAASWNTGQEKASPQSVRSWLLAPAAQAGVVVVGLQEVEVGAGVLGMAAVKESVGMGLDKISAAGQWWLNLIDNVFAQGKNKFERVASRQLAGMLVGVWVDRELIPYVGDVEVGAVACGFGRAFGNKGAVGIKLMIFRRTICFLTSHLAAHMDQVTRRNADFEYVYGQMAFGRGLRTNAGAGVSGAVQSMLRGGNSQRRISTTADSNFNEVDVLMKSEGAAVNDEAGTPELAEADLLIWTGDLNYRIDHPSFEEVLTLVDSKQWDLLLSVDQLRHEMQYGRTFHGLREGPIRFPPTYKFDKGTDEYDTSEKKRIPAWCDRVLFRDSFGDADDWKSSPSQGLERPCKASVVWYEACMEPKESDHKPVRCMLRVDLAVTDEANRRREYGHIWRADPNVQNCLEDTIPDTVLSTNRLLLEGTAAATLRFSNGDRINPAVYEVYCEGISRGGQCPCGQHKNLRAGEDEDLYPRGNYGFPQWLQVTPASGILGPSGSVSISVKSTAPERSGKDQHGDKAVILSLKVKGVSSSEYKQHRICVCYGSSSGRTLRREKDGGPRYHSQVAEQRRPSSAENESRPYRSKVDHGTSSHSTQNTPDFLL